MERFIVISGCSGGGKSSLLEELAGRGYAVVEEPGRRIVQRELDGDGSGLPWNDISVFARHALELAFSDYRAALNTDGLVFFDRGIVDAAAVLIGTSSDLDWRIALEQQYYNRNVFLTPPWPEIYVQDSERRHSFGYAVAEYERLVSVYPAHGYTLHILPKVSVSERADFVLDVLRKL
ncbi:MAG: AAA family ATPase [Pseudomonadota bacterium]